MGEIKNFNANKVSKELIYKGNLFNVYKEKIHFSNNREVNWDLVDHNGASAVFAIDENEDVILVKQYRNTLDRIALEIPAGGINNNEDALTCAKRELEEETGYSSDDFELLIDYIPSIGFSNEMIKIYYAKNIKYTGKISLDPDEFLTVEKININKLYEMIISGKIIDGKTISAVLMYKSLYKK